MQSPNITQKSIVISGGVTIDWNLIIYQDARDTTTFPIINDKIRRIPYILGRVGYTVVKLDGGG